MTSVLQTQPDVRGVHPLVQKDSPAAPAAQPVILIRNLSKAFSGDVLAVNDFSLEVEDGEVVSLLGPSGCGKTTTLRCLSGLETPDRGEIVVDGNTVYSSAEGIMVPPEHRGLSMVFQQYALWPHMDVFDNVAFGLRVKGFKREELNEKTEAALRRVQLWEKRHNRISELSGGQQQRVALARAISFMPKIILFDEPLSNLDAKLREELRVELLQLQRELKFTAIYVTHDQDEAISLSSRIVIMNGGKCEQVASPQHIWREPETSFVARFIGSTNALSGTVLENAKGVMRVSTEAGVELRARPVPALAVGDAVEVFIRITDLVLSGDAPAPGTPNRWESEVKLVSFEGGSTLFSMTFGDRALFVRRSGEAHFAEGDKIHLHIDPDKVRCYPAARPATGQHPQ